jgi:hypothetical protein
MTIPSQFASWLAVAERDGQGGTSAEPPAINRGRTRIMKLALPASDTYSDWTGGTFAARLRAAPGAAGDPLASYSCSIGTPAGGVTPITLTLDDAAQGSLPAADPATGLAEVFLEVVFTPTAGDPDTIMSVRQLVRSVI